MPSMTIDGDPVSAPATFEVIDPSTGEVCAVAPDCTLDLLDRAMASAAAALPAWQADGDRRSELMRKVEPPLWRPPTNSPRYCRRRRASRFRLPLPSRRSATCGCSTTRASQCRARFCRTTRPR